MRSAAEQAPQFAVPPQTDELLDIYCFSCHDEDTQKGDLRLDQLDELSLDARLNLLNKMQEQLFFGEMPPRKNGLGDPTRSGPEKGETE